MNVKSAAVILTLLLCGQAAGAADSTPAPEASKDPVIERYRAASERQDWKSAAALMQEAVAKDPRNADYHNLYAYSLRKSGTGSMDLVFKHYDEALRIDPKHRGAREYLGEAYLQVGNVAKAKEQLSALDKLCFFGCEEYDDLKKAIAAYEKK